MDRGELQHLEQWRTRKNRKPLIVRGARQVGKTWLVREFARNFSNLVEINFDKHPEKARLFQSRDIGKILQFLQIDANTDIIPGRTLLFLDEIQAAPEVLPLLRYFFEERPDLHVIGAGSLLEFVLADHDFAMPVGRVEYLHLGPMSITDFLRALGEERLASFLADFSLADAIPEPIHQTLLHYMKLFWVVGGMPAAVAGYRDSGRVAEAAREHEIILQTYEDDFSRYGRRIYPPRLRKVFRRLPAMVGGRLKYVQLDPEERARELADTLHLLELAQIWHRVRHSAGNGVPLGAEVKERDFKPLFLDIGLVSTSLGLSLSALETEDDLLLVNNGALAEQFVGQHLLDDRAPYERPRLFYWHRQQKSAGAEVDYLIAHGERVVPVEVKAGATGSLKSLQVFVTEKKTPVAVRFNAMPPSVARLETAIVGREKQPYLLLSLPLYLAGQSQRLLAVSRRGLL
ncbi:MAG: ATP-binding protein [Desulfurivibrionaceae bacterium]